MRSREVTIGQVTKPARRRIAILTTTAIVLLCGGMYYAVRLLGSSPLVSFSRGVPIADLRHPSGSEPSSEYYQRVMVEYARELGRWKRNPENFAGRKAEWLDLFRGIIQSGDQSEIPSGLFHSALALAHELGDDASFQVVALVGAEHCAIPQDRALLAAQYLQSELRDCTPGSKRWNEAASLSRDWATRALADLATHPVSDLRTDMFAGIAGALASQAADLLAGAGMLPEAAEMEEAGGRAFSALANPHPTAGSDALLPEQWYQRAAGRWSAAGDPERALAAVSSIDKLGSTWRDASWHALVLVTETTPAKSSSNAESIRTWVGRRWLDRGAWTSPNDIRLAQAIMVANARHADSATDVLLLGDRILNEHADLLAKADEQARLEMASVPTPGSVSTSISAEVFQAMAIAAQRIGDRTLAEYYRSEFASRFPDHPSNKARR